MTAFVIGWGDSGSRRCGPGDGQTTHLCGVEWSAPSLSIWGLMALVWQ